MIQFSNNGLSNQNAVWNNTSYIQQSSGSNPSSNLENSPWNGSSNDGSQFSSELGEENEGPQNQNASPWSNLASNWGNVGYYAPPTNGSSFAPQPQPQGSSTAQPHDRLSTMTQMHKTATDAAQKRYDSHNGQTQKLSDARDQVHSKFLDVISS